MGIRSGICFNENEMTKIFTKPPLSIEDQILLLQKRGMQIESADIDKAKFYLSKVGYYKLSGYWFIFQEKYLKTGQAISKNNFCINVSFNDVRNIYIFDAKLRNLFLEALARCETAIKSAIGNYMSVTMNDAFWYCDKKYFSDIKSVKTVKDKHSGIKTKTSKTILTYDEWYNDLQNSLKNITNCEFKNSYYEKYSNTDLPSWMALELMSFGAVSKLYQMINNKHHKKQIAKTLNVGVDVFSNALQVMHLIRNKCAHYGRLYNFVNNIYPCDIEHKIFKPQYNYKFSNNKKTQQLLFPVFYQIAYFLNNISGHTKWVERVKAVIDEYSAKSPHISYKKMGFPDGWEELPLFQDMLNIAPEINEPLTEENEN